MTKDAKEDVIQFYNINDPDTKNYWFSTIVDLIGHVTQFYGSKADIVAIADRGLPDHLGIGIDTVVTSSNVSDYQSLFAEWGGYMKANGQIHFFNSVITQTDAPSHWPWDPPHGVDMLNAIAAYTHQNVFANDDWFTPTGWGGEEQVWRLDFVMEYASNGNPSSYNCIYNHDLSYQSIIVPWYSIFPESFWLGLIYPAWGA